MQDTAIIIQKRHVLTKYLLKHLVKDKRFPFEIPFERPECPMPCTWSLEQQFPCQDFPGVGVWLAAKCNLYPMLCRKMCCQGGGMPESQGVSLPRCSSYIIPNSCVTPKYASSVGFLALGTCALSEGGRWQYGMCHLLFLSPIYFPHNSHHAQLYCWQVGFYNGVCRDALAYLKDAIGPCVTFLHACFCLL